MLNVVSLNEVMERFVKLSAHSDSSVLDKAFVATWLIQQTCMWNNLPETYPDASFYVKI